jgi:hypothetical protein
MRNKFLSFLLALFIPFSQQAQSLFSENFQNYNGFGDALTGGWTTSGVGGYKVYLRDGSASTGIKYAEIPLSNNKKGDSLITPSIGPVAGNAILTFKSRMIDAYTGNIATFNHIPAAGDKVAVYISTNGGNSYTLLQDITNQYPTSGTALASFSIPLTGVADQMIKIKFVSTLTSGSFYVGFDDVDVSLATSTNKPAFSGNPSIQLFPNPSTGLVQIRENGFSPAARIEVFNILGNRVETFSSEGEKTSLDLSHLKAGVYLIKMIEGKQTAISRLVLK